MRKPGPLVIAAAALISIPVASPARAEPTQAELAQARETFAQAERDERAGNFGAALAKLRQIEKIKATPGILFHIALCEENTGHLAAALEEYAIAEKKATDEKNRDVLAALKEPMAALRARVPRLVIRVPPDVKGLEVTLDAKVLPVGYYGAEIPVDPRAHTVEAKAQGKKRFFKSLSPSERESVTVDVILEDERAGVPAASPPAPVAKVEPTPAPASTKHEPEATHGGAKVGAILATAGTVALAGAGVAVFFVADAMQSDAKSQCATRTTDCEDLRAPIRLWDSVALGSWIAAGALGTVAVVLWLTPDGSANTTGRVFVGPGSAGIAGSF